MGENIGVIDGSFVGKVVGTKVDTNKLKNEVYVIFVGKYTCSW